MEFKNIRVKEILAVQNYKTKNAKWKQSCSHYYTLQLKLHGKAIHSFKDRRMVVTDNCIYFLNQHEEQEIEIFGSDNEISSIAINFTTYEPIKADSFCIKTNNIEEIKKLFKKLEKQLALTDKGDNLALSYFYKICAIFEDLRQKEYSPKDERMVNAREYIDLHFGQKKCIENAAKESKLSRRRFNELFRNQFNITPNRYLIIRRVEHAMQLLKLADTTIPEISELCGFGDLYYFSKVFKKETGKTPGKFRQDFR